MNAVVLTLPDDPEAVPDWLERQLVGPDLSRLAAELTAVHGPPPARSPLASVLAEHREDVLRSGLNALPRPALSRLLRQPDLLLELQQMVLTEGGPYWDRVTVAPADEAAAVRVAGRVMRMVSAEARPRRPFRWAWAGYAVAALVGAAAVLAVLYLRGFPPPPGVPPSPETSSASGWGFARLHDLPRDAGDAVVLDRLAKLAKEWSEKRPTDAAELARRLGEFRQGCSALLLTDDLPLSAPQRRWLRLRCGDWAAATDAELRRLEETGDVAGVRAAADATAVEIARELRERAEAAQGG